MHQSAAPRPSVFGQRIGQYRNIVNAMITLPLLGQFVQVKISGAPCPKAIRVDLCVTTSHECGDALPGLHLDHSYDAKHVCEVWSEALPDDPVSWDDGLCGALVAHLLFGVEGHVLAQCSTRPIWQPRLTFRCGDVKGVKGQHAAGFCHDVAGAHYKHVLEVKDLRWPSA